MLYNAREGVSIGRLYSSNRTNLGPILSWLYWALEFGIICWVTKTMGTKEALISVCESCGGRYGREMHLGGTSPDNKSILLDLIKQNNFAEIGKLINKNADLPSLSTNTKVMMDEPR